MNVYNALGTLLGIRDTKMNMSQSLLLRNSSSTRRERHTNDCKDKVKGRDMFGTIKNGFFWERVVNLTWEGKGRHQRRTKKLS